MGQLQGAAIVRLDDVRRERESAPGRTLALAIREVRRRRTLVTSETLDDATRGVHSARFRPIDRKLSREIRDAVGLGCDASELRAALLSYVDALVPAPRHGRIAA